MCKVLDAPPPDSLVLSICPDLRVLLGAQQLIVLSACVQNPGWAVGCVARHIVPAPALDSSTNSLEARALDANLAALFVPGLCACAWVACLCYYCTARIRPGQYQHE